MAKKVKDMTDEEINEEFERQYKQDYLYAKENTKRRKRLKLITILFVFGGLFLLSALRTMIG